MESTLVCKYINRNKKIEPKVIDIYNLRKERQKNNNNKVENGFINNFNIFEMKKICNKQELDRVLEETNLTYDDLLQKCQTDNIFCTVLSGRISIRSSRQGSKDESYILNECNNTSSKCGVFIKSLDTNDSVPTKSGEILSRKEANNRGINNSECLKSFDGKITGKIEGYIFLKVTIGNGGHQDNVFEEANIMGEWMLKYNDSSKLYVLLIDTNLHKQFDNIKNKYHKNNILVVNHIEFQQYLIKTYSK